MNCTNCVTKQIQEADFCVNCGTKFEDVDGIQMERKHTAIEAKETTDKQSVKQLLSEYFQKNWLALVLGIAVCLAVSNFTNNQDSSNVLPLIIWVVIGWIGARFVSLLGGVATFLLGWQKGLTWDGAIGLKVFSILIGGIIGSLVVFIRFIVALGAFIVVLIRVIIALTAGRK